MGSYLGDDAVTSAEGTASIASAGIAKALMADADFLRSVKYLQLEMNRFGPQAPVGLQYVTPALDINGLLDANTASRAVAILQRRYQDSAVAFPGEAQASIDKLAQVTSAAAVVDPISFVMAGPPTAVGGNAQVGVSATTGLIQAYGDSKGLPPAVSLSIFDYLTSDTNTLIVAAGAVAVGYYLWKRKSAKGRR